MKKHLIITLILFICILSVPNVCNSQSINDSINRQVISFLESEGVFDNVNIHKEKLVHVINLSTQNELGEESYGIYYFLASISHTKYYLLTKNKDSFKILDIDDFGNTISEVVLFLNNHNTSNDEMVELLEEIIKMYKSNQDRSFSKTKVIDP